MMLHSKKCENCYNPDIDLLIYQAKYALIKLSKDSVQRIKYGYGCDPVVDAKIQKLQSYYKVLEREYSRLNLGGESCLKPKYLQAISEKIRKISTSCDINSRIDLKIDTTHEQEWILNNPYCVSRESWEKIAYSIGRSFSLDVDIIQCPEDYCKECVLDVDVMSKELFCDFTFEIVRNLIPCDVVVAMSIYKESCDLDLQITRTKEECKIDFDLLQSETNCDLTFEQYLNLIDCNISFDVIKTVYSNGCGLEENGGEVLLVSALNKYPVKAMNFTKNINPHSLKQLKLTNPNSKFLENPKSFIKKIKSDYGK